MSYTIKGTPQFGVYTNIAANNVASTVSGVTVNTNNNVTLGVANGVSFDPATTGNPLSLVTEIDGAINLAASATMGINLNSWTQNGVTKTLTAARTYHFVNTNAATSLSGSSYTVEAAGANPWTDGPFSSVVATTVPANSEIGGSNKNYTAQAWTVNSGNCTLIITAGANGATGYFCFAGE